MNNVYGRTPDGEGQMIRGIATGLLHWDCHIFTVGNTL